MAGQEADQQYTVAIQQTDMAGQVFNVQILETVDYGGRNGINTAEVLYEGSVTLGASTQLSETNPCEIKIRGMEVEIAEVNIDQTGMGGGNVILELINREQTLDIPEGDETIGEPQCDFVVLANNYFDSELSTRIDQSKIEQKSSLLDFFVSDAYANEIQRLSGLSAVRTTGNTYTISALEGPANFGEDLVIWSGTVDAFRGSMPLSNVQNLCNIPNVESVTAEITDANSSEMSIRLVFSDGGHTESYTILAASGTLVANDSCPL